jgi:hypothetical protein
MKLPFAFLLALFVAGCTSWDANTGKFFTNADNDGVDLVAPNGAHLHIDHNHHSPIVHAYGSAGGRLIGAAGSAFTGYTYAKQDLTFAGAAVGAVPSITNRQTNRATPAPAPAPQRPQ